MIQKHQSNVLITGVSSGIGYALVVAYLRRGATVWGVSRRTPVDLTACDGFHFIEADLADPDAAYRAMTSAMSGIPQLDLAVLNAGQLGEFGDMADATLNELRKLMDVNLWSNKTVLDALFSLEIAVRQVVTMSSGAAINGNRGWSGYALSKAALNMLTKLYAAERPETHFCAFAPGLVDTAMQATIADLEPDARFPSLDVLRSKRQTADMPSPTEAADQIVAAFARLPDRVASGDFADIRNLDLA